MYSTNRNIRACYKPRQFTARPPTSLTLPCREPLNILMCQHVTNSVRLWAGSSITLTQSAKPTAHTRYEVAAGTGGYWRMTVVGQCNVRALFQIFVTEDPIFRCNIISDDQVWVNKPKMNKCFQNLRFLVMKIGGAVVCDTVMNGINWLIDWSINWLIDQLTDWSIDWFIY
jgi:hypothetical protein